MRGRRFGSMRARSAGSRAQERKFIAVAAPAPAADLEEQPLRVHRVRAALEAVKDDDAGAAGGSVHVIDREARRRPGVVRASRRMGDEAAGADQASPDRLEVGARKPAGRTKTARIGIAGSQENLHPFLT